MSVNVMTWAWKQELPTGPKFVLVALADNANSDGLCYPGQDSIAAKCGMTGRTVRNSINHLIDAGLVSKQHRQKTEGRGRSSDLYQIMIPGAKPLHQPENISGNKRGNQPEKSSTRKAVDKSNVQPEEFSGKNTTNRKNLHNQPENISGSSNKEVEPSEEPSVAETRTHARDALADVLGKHWQPHQILHPKTLPMLVDWVGLGVTPQQVDDAIAIATAKLGELPAHPTYLRNIMSDLLKPAPPGTSSHRGAGNRQQALEDSNRAAVQEAMRQRQSQQGGGDEAVIEGEVFDA